MLCRSVTRQNSHKSIAQNEVLKAAPPSGQVLTRLRSESNLFSRSSPLIGRKRRSTSQLSFPEIVPQRPSSLEHIPKNAVSKPPTETTPAFTSRRQIFDTFPSVRSGKFAIFRYARTARLQVERRGFPTQNNWFSTKPQDLNPPVP